MRVPLATGEVALTRHVDLAAMGLEGGAEGACGDGDGERVGCGCA